jgi:hypothetical protein
MGGKACERRFKTRTPSITRVLIEEKEITNSRSMIISDLGDSQTRSIALSNVCRGFVKLCRGPKLLRGDMVTTAPDRCPKHELARLRPCRGRSCIDLHAYLIRWC